MLCMILLGAVCALAQSDTQPPDVMSFDYAPATIDTGLSSQAITFTVHLTDDVSGIHAGPGTPTQAQFKSPSGNQSVTVWFDGEDHLLSGNKLDGVFSNTVILPRYSESGIWRITSLLLVDEVNNTLSLNKVSLEGRGFSTEIEILSPGDSQPPNLISFDFSPKVIDTGQSSQTMIFTAHITDNISGLFAGVGTPTQARFNSPSGNQTMTVSFDGVEQLESGSQLDGVFSSTASLPQYCEGGTWLLSSFSLVDQVGNKISLDKVALDAQAVPTEFEVVSQGDTESPNLLGFDLTPGVINTGASLQTLTFASHVTDNMSGLFSGAGTLTQTRFNSPSGDQTVTVSFDGNETLVSGSSLDGIFMNTISLPQYSESGIWQLSYFLLVDQVGNRKSLSQDDLEASDFTAQFEVVNTLLHDWNGDGIRSIIGDVPGFVNAVYFNQYPDGWSQEKRLAVGDGNGDGILSIIGDVPPFVNCVYFQNCGD